MSLETNPTYQDILTLPAGIKRALDGAGDMLFERYLTQCQAQDEQARSTEMLAMIRLLR